MADEGRGPDDIPALGDWHQHPRPHLVIDVPASRAAQTEKLKRAGLIDIPVFRGACPWGCGRVDGEPWDPEAVVLP